MKRFLVPALLISLAVGKSFAQPPDTLNLLPRPESTKITQGRFIFSDGFTVSFNGPQSDKFVMAVNAFFQRLGRRVNINFPQEFISSADNKPGAQLFVSYRQAVEPAIGMDESYALKVTADQISINAATDIGAERGLETLYQLIQPDRNAFYCPLVEINDSPRFKWRGLMIDVSRHFMPFEVLKRNVDAMAVVKMNVLHLHLSDDEGFRVESKVFPLLQQKGSNGFYYTQDQIKELVKYAHDRGVIIVPEFDLPGHCSSILAAYPELGSYKADYKPGRRYKLDTVKNLNMMTAMKFLATAVTPTIDPTKESTYVFFDKFIKEMGDLFPDAYFHVGADENNGAAWKQNAQITAFMQAKGMKTTDDLQAYFVKRMYDIAKKHHKRLIGWEEAFNQDIPQDMIVQKWKPGGMGPALNAQTAIQHGNQVIVSAGYYLDLFMPAYIHYLTDPVPADMSPADADKGILGAEAAQWAELMDGSNEELRVWPRAAAIAERLWSPANVKDADDMYRRLWVTDSELNLWAINENKEYQSALSFWVNDVDISPLFTLVNVCTPIRGYKRLMGGMFAGKITTNLNSPLINIADIVHCDSETGREFRQLVAAYLKDHKAGDLQNIRYLLQRWQNNKARFDGICAYAPYPNQIKDLSDNLSAAAAIGLDALNGQGNKDEQLKQLQALEKPLHEVQIAVLPEIEALVTGALKAEPAVIALF